MKRILPNDAEIVDIKHIETWYEHIPVEYIIQAIRKHFPDFFDKTDNFLSYVILEQFQKAYGTLEVLSGERQEVTDSEKNEELMRELIKYSLYEAELNEPEIPEYRLGLFISTDQP